jgi:anti-sigma factor ChrR (cupin superfamily)|tara:strand:+ start:337 stop:702 length:366 start_codon:yes stop_codon:yes gene_type:complete
MNKRKITDLYNLQFVPFDNYGEVIPGMSWHKISYDKSAGGQGTYVLKMEPGSKSLPHTHDGHEEFLILDGDLVDPDGKIFKKGDFISFEPGSKHSSYSKNGCLVLVFMRGINIPLKKNNVK